MKICRCVYVPILLLFLANGCGSVLPKELVSKKNSESFCLVLVRPPDRGILSLPIKIDDYRAKLKSGSFLELELSSGIHSFSVKRGYFPPASTNVSGHAGERRYFSYVMQFGPVDVYLPINDTGGTDITLIDPIEAAWKEISQEEFESQFPHAKFNN